MLTKPSYVHVFTVATTPPRYQAECPICPWQCTRSTRAAAQHNAAQHVAYVHEREAVFV